MARIDSMDDIRALWQKGELETVVCAIPDIWGRLVGKRVRVPTFLDVALGSEGLHGSLYLFCVDVDMDPQDGYALTDWERGFQDCRFVPDLSTLRTIPWMEKTAVVVCDAYYEDSDEIVPMAPRSILKRQVARAREAGLSLKCATELEFYLFRDSFQEAWDKRYEGLSPTSRFRSDYHVLQSTMDESFIGRARELITEAGVEVEFSKPEWGLGQQEINLRYDEALEMADRHTLYKTWIKELAALDGMSATFMAKPFFEDVGSSCHVHASLWSEDGRQAVGWQADAEDQMSDTMGGFLGGLVAHSRDFTVFFAPNINSYKRIQPDSFAPTSLAVGLDNRTCGFRLIGHGDSFRVENRIPGADVNPYLAIAGMIAAGLAGLEGGAARPSPLPGQCLSRPGPRARARHAGRGGSGLRRQRLGAADLGRGGARASAALLHGGERCLPAALRHRLGKGPLLRADLRPLVGSA